MNRATGTKQVWRLAALVALLCWTSFIFLGAFHQDTGLLHDSQCQACRVHRNPALSPAYSCIQFHVTLDIADKVVCSAGELTLLEFAFTAPRRGPPAVL